MGVKAALSLPFAKYVVRVNDNWKFTLGARNIFDTYPDKVDRIASNNDACCGRDYNSGMIIPW